MGIAEDIATGMITLRTEEELKSQRLSKRPISFSLPEKSYKTCHFYSQKIRTYGR